MIQSKHRKRILSTILTPKRPGGDTTNRQRNQEDHNNEVRGGSLVSAGDQKSAEIKVPVAITVFPDEVFRAQEKWARRAFHNVIYFHEADRGGHFAAWEYPELFAGEIRAAFRSLR